LAVRSPEDETTTGIEASVVEGGAGNLWATTRCISWLAYAAVGGSVKKRESYYFSSCFFHNLLRRVAGPGGKGLSKAHPTLCIALFDDIEMANVSGMFPKRSIRSQENIPLDLLGRVAHAHSTRSK